MITKKEFENKNCNKGHGGWELKELQNICTQLDIKFNKSHSKNILCEKIKQHFNVNDINSQPVKIALNNDLYYQLLKYTKRFTKLLFAKQIFL